MRINLVLPKNLADQHLFAEWREIKMAPKMVQRSLKTRPINDIKKDIGKSYTLNKGHGLFFFDKMLFLVDRYEMLTAELLNRSYNISTHDANSIFLNNIPIEFRQIEWQPTKRDIQVNIDRIAQRLNEKPDWYRYYGDVYAPDFFIDRYNQQLLFDTIATV